MTTTNEMTELPPLPEYVTPEYLEHMKLRSGCGNGEEGDCCAIQERRRWDGIDSKSDAIPETDSLVVGKLLIQLNDCSDVWRSNRWPKPDQTPTAPTSPPSPTAFGDRCPETYRLMREAIECGRKKRTTPESGFTIELRRPR